MVFAEYSWTPGDMQQAEDRAHRIGQAQAVNIYNLHLKGSIDDVIWSTLENKLDNVGQVREPSWSPSGLLPQWIDRIKEHGSFAAVMWLRQLEGRGCQLESAFFALASGDVVPWVHLLITALTVSLHQREATWSIVAEMFVVLLLSGAGVRSPSLGILFVE